MTSNNEKANKIKLYNKSDKFINKSLKEKLKIEAFSKYIII